MMMREQEALWLLLPGVRGAVARRARRRSRVAGSSAAWCSALAALIAFSPQMAVWHYYTGSPLHPAQVEPLRPTTPFIVVALFSTRGGLFPWSPVAYASLVGVFLARGGARGG